MIQQDKRIIQELDRRGLQAEWQTVTKNEIPFDAILIKTPENFAPVIYTNNLLDEHDTVESAVEKILLQFEQSKCTPIDARHLLSRDYILQHITIALQRDGQEPILKRESGFKGIEAYLLVIDTLPMDDDLMSMKITQGILRHCHITEEEAWVQAEKNLQESAVIKSFQEILGLPCDLFVITNKFGMKGASCVLASDLIEEFAKEHHTHRLVVIPSSIHEMLLMPDTGIAIEEDLSAMVRDVNKSIVLPEEQLADQIYYIEV